MLGFAVPVERREAIRRGGDDAAVRLVVLLAAAVLAVAVATPPADSAGKPRPTARAWVALDDATGRVLIAQRAHELRPVASLTKMMTGLLVAEAGGLDERIPVPVAATLVEPSREGLRGGARYKRRTLLYSALLQSANDSATALAYDLGGGSLQRFFALANDRARRIGMLETTYASASGLDDRINISTAYDQALLARAAMRDETFAAVVGTRRYFTRWSAPTIAKEWVNHNRMLVSYPGTYGVKTGWTTKAGACIALAVHRGKRSVILVVLGSKSIWTDAPVLVDRAFDRWRRAA
jgi:serine-type D-Ala-D-Ala carboxypeptidase (penicillin-binding protein 5/6)